MNSTIESLFTTKHGERAASLEDVRICAALTKPWLLPPQEGSTDDQKLAENYQSLGSRGITNLEGRTLMGVFPPMIPWIRQQASAEIRLDPNTDLEALALFEQSLFLQDMLIQASLETSSRDPNDPTGFRTAMRMVIGQVLVTGEALARMDDDFKFTVFRRDNYVNCRAEDGRILFHVTRQMKDVLSLSPEQFGKTNLNREDFVGKYANERMRPLFTMVEWQHDSKNWVIRQEINGQEINTTEEPISPFVNPYFELVTGDNYARGFVELNRGDLRAFNTLSERLLDFAAMASKLIGFLDAGSDLKPSNFTGPTGSIVEGARVTGGQLQDFAFLHLDKLSDFRVVYETRQALKGDLGAAMLIQSESVRDSERTTAFEVAEVTIKELEGALGGFYAPLADRLQVPIAHRARYVLKKQKKLPPIPNEAVEIQTLTGIAALAQMNKATTLMSVAQMVQGLGPDVVARLDMNVLVDAVLRYRGVYEPGLLKSREQVEAEMRKAMEQQAQMQATEKGIDVAGNVAQAAMTPQGPQ